MKPAHRFACLFNLVMATMLVGGAALAQDGASGTGQASAAPGASPPSSSATAAASGASTALGASATVNDRAHDKLLLEGVAVLRAGQPQRAIDEYFDRIIAANDKLFASLDATVYAARSPTESLAYMFAHGADSGRKTNAVVVSSSAAYAHYMKAYALVELKRDADARTELERALALSPDNAQFLEELASWYLRRRDWAHALENFQHAERSAMLSPETKNRELGAAWRGMGYIYVEQHRFDDAEAIYKKCLELDAGDNKARGELEYVRQQRAKAG